MVLRDITWTEIPRTDTSIIPVGSLEQHGPHLPFETDTIIAADVARAVGEKINALVAPAIPVGISDEHMDFQGTLSISAKTLTSLLSDISGSLKRHGFTKQYIINAHGGNTPVLEKFGEKNKVPVFGTLGYIGKFDHAGEVETSLMLYLKPDAVRTDKIRDFEFTVPKGRSWKTKDHTESGVIGCANKATKEKGRQYFETIVESILKQINKID
ncbi:MAG: hypothetical protein MSIBF_04235 [Candidatus Altiarchaeales archaeon IMC4]|nr:MAG: hypothetical protein MSIBF_04235 [Candidatus Altiarchaeales archaeon IMC4]